MKDKTCMSSDEFHDRSMLASLSGRLANPNLLNGDRQKTCSAAALDADEMTEQRDKRIAAGYVNKEIDRRNGHVRERQ